MKTDTQNIDQQYQQVCKLILKGQWTESFKQLRQQLHGSQDQNLSGQLDTLESGYQAAMQYLISGGEDPDIQELYTETQRRLLRIASAVARDRKLRVGMNIFSVSHIEQTIREERIESLGHLEELMLKLAESPEPDERHFALHDSLFNCIYTSAALADDDAQTQLTALIGSVDEHLQAYLISALTLSCYTFFCERKMAVILHFTGSEWCDEVRARSLVGMMMIYNRYPQQVTVFPRLTAQLTDVLGKNNDNLIALYQEWVMTCATSDLHRIIEEKLMPALLKGEKLHSTQIDMEGAQAHVIKIDATDAGNDPDPKRRNALFEFIRLLKHGADTNFHTFAVMKRFDFFMSMGHWLMPFTAQHPLVKRATIGAADEFYNTIMLGTSLCSSDMYSMCSMLSLTGGQTRENMFRSMTNQISFDEDMDDEEKREALREAILEHVDIRRRMRGYLQDWYRLMMLHPAKDEMENPFQGSGLFLSPLWKMFMNDAHFLLSAARFYSGIERNTECIEMLRRYLKLVPDDADALCLLGRAYIENDTLRPAAECYRRAILAGGDEEKCLRRLCHCLMQSRNYPALLDAVERLAYLCPDDTEIQTMQATALMQSGQYEDALTQFRAIELLDEDATQTPLAARGAAWCLFCLRRYEKALEKYDSFIDDGDVRHEDLLNRGHVLWALGRTSEAADSYISHVRLFTETCDAGKANPLRVFDGDVQDLITTAHIKPLQVHMMRDYIASQI